MDERFPSPVSPPLPAPIVDLVSLLASMPSVVSVVLGGSRATGSATAESDWDLGVYYRGALDTRPLGELGTVYPPGSWGRVMNGGAWLTVAGTKVDVLLRDLATVDHWSERASRGEYEVDALLGYVAGVPTYSLLAERSVAAPLHGELPPAGPFPPRLVETAPPRWRFHAQFSLDYARMHAKRANVVGAAGQIAKAVVEHAHSVACGRGLWVLNEKRLIDDTGLGAAHGWLSAVPTDAGDLARWVDEVGAAMGYARPPT